MVSLVYMVAGLSSRFGGKIKQFAKVGPNGETVIEYSLNQALKNPFSKIIFVVGEKTSQPFKEKFGNFYKEIPVFYALQYFDAEKREKPWGTVDALCSASNLLNEPFIVCNGDDIYGENSFRILFEHLNNNNEDATLGYKLVKVILEKGAVNRGIFKINRIKGKYYITKIEEVFNITKLNLAEKNLTLKSLCSMNIFGLFPKTVQELKKILINFKDKYKNDRKIECLLPVEISNLIKNNKIKMRIYNCYDKWFGITNLEDEAIIREKLKNKKTS